jgi:hypothetical protein
MCHPTSLCKFSQWSYKQILPQAYQDISQTRSCGSPLVRARLGTVGVHAVGSTVKTRKCDGSVCCLMQITRRESSTRWLMLHKEGYSFICFWSRSCKSQGERIQHVDWCCTRRATASFASEIGPGETIPLLVATKIHKREGQIEYLRNELDLNTL